MDLSIIDAAPERARSAKKRPSSSAHRAHCCSGLIAAHRWLTARDDLNTYRLCAALLLMGMALYAFGLTSGVCDGHV